MKTKEIIEELRGVKTRKNAIDMLSFRLHILRAHLMQKGIGFSGDWGADYQGLDCRRNKYTETFWKDIEYFFELNYIRSGIISGFIAYFGSGSYQIHDPNLIEIRQGIEALCLE